MWLAEAVVGRVSEASRGGHPFYARTPAQMRRERRLLARHRVVGDVWELMRRCKALLWALLALALGASVALAAVTLVSFEAEAGSDSILLSWETASETHNIGFYLWRSLVVDTGYVTITNYIPSIDEGAGAYYEFKDMEVTPGVVYYYKLQDVPDDGSEGDQTEPITASVALPDTTPTLTPTVTSTPQATLTPNPNVRFWADKTSLAAGECATLQWQTTDIRAVFLNGVGVAGDGARTKCPCETTDYVLAVDFPDGHREDFVITITVTGECTAVQRTGTPTPTSTPNPTATVTPVAAGPAATSTPRKTRTPIPSLTPTLVTPPSSPTASPTPEPAIAAVTGSPSPVPPSATTATRGVVEGDSRGLSTETTLSIWLLVVGGIVGLGFVGAGILMWKQRQ